MDIFLKAFTLHFSLAVKHVFERDLLVGRPGCFKQAYSLESQISLFIYLFLLFEVAEHGNYKSR